MSDSAKVMRVNMLGEFSIYYNGEPIRLENNYSTKAMKALQLLLYRGEQGILRDSLLDTLFSSDSTSDPVNNLKVTLSNLRRLLAKVGLPPEVTVQSHNKRYSFVCPGGIDLDVWEFERLLGKAAASEHEEERREYLLQAADLYKGDFLPHLSGEDWVLVTAAKYRQQYFGCVQDLAALLGLQNNPLDEVLGEHGVLHGAHRHGDLAALGLHHGDVLLHGGVGGAGDDLGHLLAAAHDRHAAGLDKGDNVSAMLADIEFHSDPSSCRWYCVWHLFWVDWSEIGYVYIRE